MIRTSRLPAAAAALLVFAPWSARGQVGHTPERSPYRDIETGQTLSLSGGWLATKRDPANVAPQGSLFGTIRYDVPIGGPATFYVRSMFAPSSRRVLIPTNPAATRVQKEMSVLTSAADLGIDLSLTGNKTWRKLSPTIAAGAGLVSDFSSIDTGAYRLGTRFAFTYSLGLRYVSSARYTLRADLVNYTWRYQYPSAYFVPAADSTSILTNTRERSAYRGNWGLSAGVTIPIFR